MNWFCIVTYFHCLFLLWFFRRIDGATYYCQQGQTHQITGENSGTIVTRKQGNSFYGNNLNCNWVIDAGIDKRIKLTVASLDLQWTPTYTTCNTYDRLRINNGTTADSPFFMYICHNHNPYHVLSPGRYLHFNFYSDERNFYKHSGLEIKFETYRDDECPPRWRNLTSVNKCYYIMEQPTSGATFSEAQNYCAFCQANLVKVENLQVFNLIQDYGQNIAMIKEMWTGLNDLKSEGSYKWMDGSSLQFQQQLDTSSNTDLKDCVIHNIEKKKWQFKECKRDKYFFMCEKARVGPTTLYKVPESEEDDEGKGDFSLLWAIILGIVAGVGCVVVAIVVYFCCLRKRKNTRRQSYRQRNSSTGQASTDLSLTAAAAAASAEPSAPPYHRGISENRQRDAPPSYAESQRDNIVK